jgi:hypothetical protein
MMHILLITACLTSFLTLDTSNNIQPYPEYRQAIIDHRIYLYSTTSKQSIILQIIRWKRLTYTFEWEKPERHSETISLASKMRVIDVASAFLVDKLPANVFLGKPQLLSCRRYDLSEKMSGTAIWVAEFRINDDSPSYGLGFPQTLFIPVDQYGRLLVKVKITDGYYI